MRSIIASMTKDRVIGKSNATPWHIKGELALFKKLTAGNTVIMGRKTFESIGRVLPDRHNIILSKTMQRVDGADVCPSLETAITKAEAYGKEIFFIGGESLFAQTIGMADRLHISYIKKDFDGDKFFPEISKKEWTEVSREDMGEFEHVLYSRKAVP